MGTRDSVRTHRGPGGVSAPVTAGSRHNPCHATALTLSGPLSEAAVLAAEKNPSFYLPGVIGGIAEAGFNLRAEQPVDRERSAIDDRPTKTAADDRYRCDS